MEGITGLIFGHFEKNSNSEKLKPNPEKTQGISPKNSKSANSTRVQMPESQFLQNSWEPIIYEIAAFFNESP